jgi:hypothetical protein
MSTESKGDLGEDVGRAQIFYVIERSNSAPACHGESTFSFLNRIAGEYWDQVRALMQDWADRIPILEEYNEIRKRFRAANNSEFNSTFLELYLHECLIRAGYAVRIHPDIPGTTRHPDFMAERGDVRFYLEAISPGIGDAARGKAARTAQFYDAVNAIPCENFFIWVTELDTGTESPPVKKLRRALNAWLASLDPDDYPEGATHWPVYSWTSPGGWSASLKAMPKPSHKRGAHIQAIGVYPVTVQRGNDAAKITAAIKEKHNAYGELRLPYVIAAGMYIMGSARDDTADALYGRLSHTLTFSDSGELVEETATRDSNGYFDAPESWRNRQVAAVLIVNQLMPYYFQRADIELWRHPEAKHPLAIDLALPWPEVVFNSGLETVPASLDPVDFFDLPDVWPIGEAWPTL